MIHVCHQQSKVDHSSRDRLFVLVRIDVWQDSRQTEIGLKIKNKNLQKFKFLKCFRSEYSSTHNFS